MSLIRSCQCSNATKHSFTEVPSSVIGGLLNDAGLLGRVEVPTEALRNDISGVCSCKKGGRPFLKQILSTIQRACDVPVRTP